MSIRPPFAEAIFAGKKQYEFRRCAFRRPVDVAVVYVTKPVGLVIGEFDVLGVVTECPIRLWHRTQEKAGVDRRTFFDYFSGRPLGHAIEIGDVRVYEHPLMLGDRLPVRPPQSFQYLT